MTQVLPCVQEELFCGCKAFAFHMTVVPKIITSKTISVKTIAHIIWCNFNDKKYPKGQFFYVR